MREMTGAQQTWRPADAPPIGQRPDMTSGLTRGPRDALELTIWRIWREELGATVLPLDADYFRLGGTSLGAIRLLAKVREQTGLKLPLEAMLEAPTVETMTALVRSGAPPIMPGQRTSLVSIRGGVGRPALVCAHPIGGTVLWYRHLADALPDDVPTVGVQARGLDPARAPDPSIESMSAHYVADVLAEYDPAEVVLAGYSLGGLVAYEMARQLAAAGTPPAGVALLDAPISEQPEEPLTRARLLWSLVGNALGLDVDVETLAALPAEERTDRILRLATEHGKLPPGFGTDRLARLIDIYPINSEAARLYRPQPYPGVVDLIRPMDGRTDDESLTIWTRVSGAVRVHDVPGNHFNLVAEDNVEHVAAVFREHWYTDRAG
jgi:thioesterase domain-containing protein/acyl carrier protein